MDEKIQKRERERARVLFSLKVFVPLRSCPLKNGIGANPVSSHDLICEQNGTEGFNWCHAGCSWAIVETPDYHEQAGEWHGRCAQCDLALRAKSDDEQEKWEIDKMVEETLKNKKRKT